MAGAIIQLNSPVINALASHIIDRKSMRHRKSPLPAKAGFYVWEGTVLYEDPDYSNIIWSGGWRAAITSDFEHFKFPLPIDNRAGLLTGS